MTSLSGVKDYSQKSYPLEHALWEQFENDWEGISLLDPAPQTGFSTFPIKNIARDTEICASTVSNFRDYLSCRGAKNWHEVVRLLFHVFFARYPNPPEELISDYKNFLEKLFPEHYQDREKYGFLRSYFYALFKIIFGKPENIIANDFKSWTYTKDTKEFFWKNLKGLVNDLPAHACDKRSWLSKLSQIELQETGITDDLLEDLFLQSPQVSREAQLLQGDQLNWKIGEIPQNESLEIETTFMQSPPFKGFPASSILNEKKFRGLYNSPACRRKPSDELFFESKEFDGFNIKTDLFKEKKLFYGPYAGNTISANPTLFEDNTFDDQDYDILVDTLRLNKTKEEKIKQNAYLTWIAKHLFPGNEKAKKLNEAYTKLIKEADQLLYEVNAEAEKRGIKTKAFIKQEDPRAALDKLLEYPY